ncbi:MULTISPECIES: GlxA family transcriptional regulator [unclassified Roseibium]|uniref:GlxA family transcriptional regulator n=1 Tax=unclassified Roseibium TaxID=2629323 RepID=UPI00273FD902|nr:MULTISPECIES: GlxA family transcriptional regulator [unclassified Roseibium]
MQVLRKTENENIPQGRSICVLLFDNFSNHCLANAVEPFRAANTIARKQLYSWQHASVEGGTVTSSSGLPVETLKWQHAPPGGDYLFVMPSYGFKAFSTPKLHQILRAARARFKLLGGLDTGAWMLAAAGVLENARVTIHWDEFAGFSETFPDVDVVEDRFVLEDRIASCGGASTTFELMLEIIKKDHSPLFALEVAALFMHGSSGERPDLLPVRSGDALMREATALMRRNIETPLAIPAVAGRLKVDQRLLETRFRSEFGMTPLAVYKSIRLREARRLVQSTDLTIAEIAVRCGYQNASAMTRAYRLEFGSPPRKER